MKMCFSLSPASFLQKEAFLPPSLIQLPFFPSPLHTGSCHPVTVWMLSFFSSPCKSYLYRSLSVCCTFHHAFAWMCSLCAERSSLRRRPPVAARGKFPASHERARVWPVAAHPRAENETLSSISVCVPSSEAALAPRLPVSHPGRHSPSDKEECACVCVCNLACSVESDAATLLFLRPILWRFL